jgi:hypothetical protein
LDGGYDEERGQEAGGEKKKLFQSFWPKQLEK